MSHPDTILVRGAAKDLVSWRLPPFPERLALHAAHQAAVGWLPGDTEKPPDAPEDWTAKPSGTFSNPDLSAVLWAAMGLCAADGLTAKLPRLRDHGRDVVAYGEAVSTVLWEAGYRDLAQHFDVGRDLYNWVLHATWGEASAVTKAAEGFPKAPAPGTSSGAH